MFIPRVKVCCISSKAEAKLAINYGASALGLVGKMPSGPGVIEDELIREIAADVPPPAATFLLTSEITVEAIVAHHYKTSTNTLQLVDYLEPQMYNVLKKELPYVKLVQVIHVIDDSDIERAQQVAPFVHALLLDSGNPNLNIKVLGGTGKVHNWKLSRKIVEAVNIPVFLAGGLNADNVQAAIEEVGAFGIDICSGVRTNGKLDERKLENFFKNIYC